MGRIIETIAIGIREAEERFVRATGPGGQNARKEATAVELRLDMKRSSLPKAVKVRLAKLAGRAVTGEGVLVIVSRAQRSQAANRQAARFRLGRLLRRAATPPAVRRATKPDAAVGRQRVELKRIRGAMKELRARVEPVEP